MTRPLFTVVIPTIGRETLPKTLDSIPDGVEVIVVADTFELPPSTLENIQVEAKVYGARFIGVDAGFHDWGSPQLQAGYAAAEGEWILNCGDDDIFEPFAFETIKRAIDQLAAPVPLMFRTALHPTWPDPRRGNRNITVLWQAPELIDRNITGQCFVIPNDQSKIGRWDILVDFGFITSTVELWDGQVEWRTEVISQCY
jgi:glycosyltransferase involved in cell wall biosynthesis